MESAFQLPIFCICPDIKRVGGISSRVGLVGECGSYEMDDAIVKQSIKKALQPIFFLQNLIGYLKYICALL